MFAPSDERCGLGGSGGSCPLTSAAPAPAAPAIPRDEWSALMHHSPDLHSPLPPALAGDDTFTTHGMDTIHASPDGFMQQQTQQQPQHPAQPYSAVFDPHRMPPPQQQHRHSQSQQHQTHHSSQSMQPYQQQQQQYTHAAHSNPHGHGQGHGQSHPHPSHPPMHLFASPYSPFASASFEVEDDINGVNPSVNSALAAEQAYLRRTQQGGGGGGGAPLHSSTQSRQQLQQQQMQASLAPDNLFRMATGDSHSGLFAQQESPIGLLPQEHMGNPLMPPQSTSAAAYDSLIDRAEQAAQGSRKRARGSTGLPMVDGQQQQQYSHGSIDMSGYQMDEPRSLEASTFAVFGPGSGGAGGSQAGMMDADQQMQGVPRTQRAGSIHSTAAATTPPAAAAAPAVGGGVRRGTASIAPSRASSGSGDSPHGSSGGGGGGGGGADDNASVLPKEERKKEKHQATDRQRRAKIKESMDALKALVPLDASQKADQATIVASSVTLVQSLKDEVQQLREKLQAMELKEAQEANKYDARKLAISQAQAQGHGGSRAQHPPHVPLLSNSPFTSMMASLNGAGVSMWRLGLNGNILEVNLVFELVSGFSAREVIGSTPCHPPMFGSLSIMPEAFLKAFSQVSAVPQVNASPYYQKQPPMQPEQPMLPQHQHQQQPRYQRGMSGSASSVSTPPDLAPHSPGESSSAGSSGEVRTPATAASTPLPATPAEHCHGGGDPFASGDGIDTPLKIEVDEGNTTVNPTSTAQGTSASQTSVAPLYANASISNFPIVPQAELQNFFPYKCRSLIHPASHNGVVQPQPHGNFLVNHLASLPPNCVLKLLCRHQTLWGEILESISTLCLVRTADGAPDYIMVLSTPDCRRLLTPATHQASPLMGPGLSTPRPAVSVVGEGDAGMDGGYNY